MYFITNSEKYIVAASKDFLEKSGSRDLCAIASSLKDGTITLESETSLFKASNFSDDLRFESSKLFSAFGTLTLYSLSQIIEESKNKTEEDENINYLKQLREGVIKKDDHEFSIPTISTIQNNETTVTAKESAKLEDREEILTPERAEKTIETISLEPGIEKEEITQTPTVEESKVVKTPAIEKDSYETIKLFGNRKVEQSKEETEAPASSEVVKLTDYSSDSNEVPSVEEEKLEESAPIAEDKETIEVTDKNIAVIEEQEKSENFGIKPLDEKQLIIEDEKPIEKVAEIVTGSEEENRAKSKGLNKLKEKLFPWGSKIGEKIELEENHNDEVLTTAGDLLDTEKEKETKEFTDSTLKEVENVTSQEPIYIETVENVVEEDEVSVPVIDTEEETIAVKEVLKEEEPQEELKVAELTLEEQELAELKQMHEEQTIARERESVAVKNREPAEVSTVEVPQKEYTQKSSSTERTKLYYKLIQMQVDGVNLEQNAKNLSIDLDSYKMLLGNYLDELDNYSEDLENRSDSTISMLDDASELLSLTPVSKKLKELQDPNSDHKSVIRDITLFESLLKEKLGEKSSEKKSKKNEEDVVVSQVVTEPKVIAEESSLPVQEVIDITSAQSLLEKIERKSVSFDPNQAADDLNLPVSLILEFVDDFIVQAKEHLSQMVKAYKDQDIKTLQTTAHMLKGAASNLRLDSVSERLFSLQKLQSMDKSEELLKEFVSKLKGLEYEVESYESNK